MVARLEGGEVGRQRRELLEAIEDHCGGVEALGDPRSAW